MESQDFQLLKQKIQDELNLVLTHPKIQELIVKLSLTPKEQKTYYQILTTYLQKGTCTGCATNSNNDSDHADLIYKVERNQNKQIIGRWILCPYREKIQQELKYRENYIINQIPLKFSTSSMEEIEHGENRKYLIRYFKDVVKGTNKKIQKGIFVHGHPGIGKTRCMAAFANELTKHNKKVAFILMPELVRITQSYINDNSNDSLDSFIMKLKKVEFLFLDDMGGESASPWFWDSVLLGILEYRMQNGLWTFFTSNYDLSKLQLVYSKMGNRDTLGTDKAYRLLERIKALTYSVELTGKSYRY